MYEIDFFMLVAAFSALCILVLEVVRTDAQKSNASRKIDFSLFFCMSCIVIEKIAVISEINSPIIEVLSQFNRMSIVLIVALRVYNLQERYPSR